MMRVYICPNCGWIRTVSRRKTVECYKCGQQEMVPSKLTFLEYSKMDEQQRNDYSESWLFIHRKNSPKDT